MFSYKNIENTVTVVYLALSIGEFISYILLYTCFKYYKSKHNFSEYKTEGRPQLLFNVLAMSIPLCVNGFLTTGLSTISTLIVPRRLVAAGIQYNLALSLIGKFSGMAMTIICFPLIIIFSMSIVLLPDLSASINNNDYFALENRINQVIKISFLLGLSSLVLCLSIPKELGILFFKHNDLETYVKMGAFSTPFMYVAATEYSILNGINKQGVMLRNSILTCLLELILLYIFTGIKSINILGCGISLFITSVVDFMINFYEIKKYYYMKVSLVNLLIYGLISSLVYLLIKILNNIIPNTYFDIKYLFLMFFGFVSFLILYLIVSDTNKELA